MVDVSTLFAFSHKVFSVPDAWFEAGQNGNPPCFVTPMGETVARINFTALRKEFAIADESDDGRLLHIVERALEHLKVIRVNESVPNDLLDGTACWTVGDQHHLIARGQITFQLVAWVTGTMGKRLNLAELAAELEKPEIKAEVKGHVSKLAQHLELGPDGGDDPDSEDRGDSGAGEVERRIDALVHEMSYIEGLRERLMVIQGIGSKARKAVVFCEDHMSAEMGKNSLGNLETIPTQLNYAIQKLDSEFSLLDKLNQNIVNMLGDMDSTSSLIRSIRDDIHTTLKIWDNLVGVWQAHSGAKDVDGFMPLLDETHRFLTENYPIEHRW